MRLFDKSRLVRCMFATFSLSLVLATFPGCNSSKQTLPQLSDSQAIELIQLHWKESRPLRVHLGTFEITKDEFDISKQRLPKYTLDSYKAWEQVGLIKIETQKDLSSGFTGWDDWNKLFVEGVQSVAYIRATEKGMPMGAEVKDPDLGPSLLIIPEGELSIDNIIKNESMRIGLDDYRAVFGIYTADYTPVVRDYYEKSDRTTERENKFKALLEFDPFLAKWNVIATDEAGLSQPFRTNTVNYWLRQAAENSNSPWP
jgi:hypothetical protein